MFKGNSSHTCARILCVGWCEWFCIRTNVYTQARTRIRRSFTRTHTSDLRSSRVAICDAICVRASAQFIRLVTRITAQISFTHTRRHEQLIVIDERT